MSWEAADIMACVDCMMWIANGDFPESDDSDWKPENVYARWDSSKWNLCCGDSENDEEFSNSECECCGSKLAGSRHHIVALPIQLSQNEG